ncbi:MAG TPA: CinA family protein [Stellaceae bacterium]|nr:CinA family protein [Stellaceae bacterium]
MSDDRTRALAESVLTRCREKKLMIATAESCTGGMIAGALTDIAGSSDVVERGFVTYSNRAKTEVLGVPAALIAWHGAVSAEVARAMATGALAHAPVELAVAVTGIAGPGGGSAEKPVGLVHLALARRGEKVHSEQQVFPGDRSAIRRATVERALALLFAAAER